MVLVGLLEIAAFNIGCKRVELIKSRNGKK